MNTKICTQCKIEKHHEEFSHHPTSKDLRHSWCKSCMSKKNKKRREALKKIPKYKRPGKQNYRTRTYAKVIRQQAVHIHRARELDPDGPIDADINIRKLMYRDDGICQLCKGRVTIKDASIDHRIPLAEGGSHIWLNVQLAHLTCNLKKGKKMNKT